MRKRLTKRSVDGAAAGSLVWDTDLVGFGLRVHGSGRKVYLVRYGAGRRGRSKWVTIGDHGAARVDREGRPFTLTPETARDEARRLLGEKAAGNDPAVKRDAAKAMPSVAEFAKRYLESYAIPHKKASSVDTDRGILGLRQPKDRDKARSARRRTIVGLLEDRRLDRLPGGDVARLHLAWKGTPTRANRAVALLSHMHTIAVRWRVLSQGHPNPCRGLKRYRENKRRRFLSPAELGRLAAALRQLEDEQPFAVAAIRLLVLTGARVSEILNLRWADVDLARGVLELPDSKAGAKTIYLNPPAREILAGLPKISGNPYVVVGRNVGERLVDLGHVWAGVAERTVGEGPRAKTRPARKGARQLAGLEGVRLHDLRHSFASVAVSAGASLPLIGGLLGHASPTTTARYAHLAADPLRALADRAGEVITAAMRGGPTAEVEQHPAHAGR